MGGYGVVNVIGGGYSEASATFRAAPPNRLLAGARRRESRLSEGARSADQGRDRDRAVGHAGRLLGRGGLEGHPRRRCCSSPAASTRSSGYEKGTQRDLPGRGECRSLSADVHQRQPQRRGADSGARGNVRVLGAQSQSSPFTHYADAVWDTTRMNNILDHFATAFFDLHLKGERTSRRIFDVVAERQGRVSARSIARQADCRRTPTGRASSARRPSA